MKTYAYSLVTFGSGQIRIGRQGENLATRIDVDVAPWKTEYPTGTVSLFVVPPVGNGYLAALEENGNTIRWTIRDTDTAYDGHGKAELILTDASGTVIKSVTAYTICAKSPSAAEPADPPEAIRPWVEQILEAIKRGDVSAEAIAAAVEAYIQEHGVQVEETDPTVPDWAKQPSKPTYTASEVGALPSSYTPPVTSVNGKTGEVALSAQDVEARPDTWTPTADDVGADAAGTASGAVAAHNTSGAAHADLRALIEGLNNRLNTLADSDDTTLDQLSEIVAYIKSNKSLIDAVTTGKVSTSDIVDNLTTNASGKVLSASQGVALKAMIDGIVIPTALPNPQPITINGQRYDGSEAVTVTVSSEGGGTPVEIDDTLTQSGKAADAKAVGDQLGALNEAKAQKASKRGYYMHISFDDVETCIGNLASGSYVSLWDEPLFGWLKGLHEQYGAKFSLYVYNISQLSGVPDTFKSEFMAAKDWLKLGLHSNTSSGTYAESTYESGQADWNTVVNQVVRFAGSHESIDRIPRLNYFSGALNALRGMRDAECGALGFLCSDEDRDSYYLSNEQNTYLRTHDHLIDFTNGLIFYQTDMRGDWFASGFTSEYEYDAPTADSVYNEMVRRFETPKYADTYQSLIWFAHEWRFYSDTTLNSYKVWTEDACRFAYDYGIPFDYPQDRIGVNPTSFQFLSVSSGEDATVETTNITLDKSELSFTTSEPQMLAASVEPSDSTQAITWGSSNTSVATVSGGMITPVGNGECMITATSGAYSATCAVSVSISDSGAEESSTFLLSEKTTFEIGSGGYYPSGKGNYELTANNARLSADIKNVEFAVGDTIDIVDYTMYDYSVGTNYSTSSANNRVWINGGYLGAPYTLVEADLLDAWVIMIKRNDGADITQTDIDYINANAKVVRSS